ncbi:MAG: hypothetical protein ABIS51_18100 [Sphingomonas sp.]
MQAIVTIASLVMGSLCFALFLWLSAKAQTATPSEPARQMAEKASGLAPANIGELTDLVKALSTLSESLSKAGPALTVLIGSILFLALAALASGAIVCKPTPAPCEIQSRVVNPEGTKPAPGATPPADQPKK